MNRLKLIWYALTAPKRAIENRTAQIEFELDQAFIEDTQRELNALKLDAWQLNGVSIAHYSDIDIDTIERFLRRAPATIQRLIDTVTPKEQDMQRWASEVMEEMD